MRLLFFVALSFLAYAAQVCNGRPQINENVISIEEDQVTLATPAEFTQDESNDKDVDVSVVDALKDISKSLKEKFILLGDKIREKMKELKQAAGDNVQKVKAQLKNLKLQLKDSFRALKHQVRGFFTKGQYASLGGNAVQIYGKIVELRNRLKVFAKGVKHVTVDNLKKMKEVAKQLRKDIKMKVQELLHGSSASQTALYHASDDDDEDNEAYIIATLKDISKTLKEKFLILVERLKQKFAELKQVGRQQAEKIKGQIQILKEKVADAREDVKRKLQELYKPAQYASFGEHAMEIFAKLYNLREKLNTFLEGVKNVTGEKLEKLKGLIKETRQEIKERVQELIGSRSDKTALYQASDADEDREASIVDILKDISKTLKKKFQVLGQKIKQKLKEIKKAAGERVGLLKKQLKELKGELGEAASDMKKKVQELVQPGATAQYGLVDDVSLAVSENLETLRNRLQSFLENVQQLAGEKLTKMQEAIRELRNAIKQIIQKLLHGKTELESTATPEPTSAMHPQY